ncbi:MAG: hypothetical protein AAB349_01740, partial [Chloroflexota bacterium]
RVVFIPTRYVSSHPFHVQSGGNMAAKARGELARRAQAEEIGTPTHPLAAVDWRMTLDPTEPA